MSSQRKSTVRFAVATLALALAAATLACGKDHAVTNKLAELVDRCDVAACPLALERATDFEWDKVAVFEVGSSRDEISRALGVRYDGETDVTMGIVFSKAGSIVHEETFPADPERPPKLRFVIGGGRSAPSCKAFTRANAKLEGKKERVRGVDYYTVTAL